MKKLQLRVPASVMHEAFDDEVVVVNMGTGHYFSLIGLAAGVWTEICAGASIEELSARPELRTFLELLEDEGLIEATGLERSSAAAAAADITTRLGGSEFAGTVEKFTDVEELLLLDPIHEVDESGWPRAADGGQ